MKIQTDKHAHWAGFALAWILLAQALGARVLFGSARFVPPVRFLGLELPLAQWALDLLFWSLPLVMVAAVGIIVAGKPRTLLDGARGFLWGIAFLPAVAIGLAALAFPPAVAIGLAALVSILLEVIRFVRS